MSNRYRAFEKLRIHTSFGWNPETQTVTCPDVVWKEYCQINPHAGDFRDHGIEEHELHTLVFDKPNASGQYSYTSTMEPINSDEDPIQEEIETAVPMTSSTSGERRPATGSGRREKKKKIAHGDFMDECLRNLVKLVSDKTEASIAADQAIAHGKEYTTSNSEVVSMGVVDDMLVAMNLENDMYFSVVTFLVDNPEWRQLFMRWPEKKPRAWIKLKFSSL